VQTAPACTERLLSIRSKRNLFDPGINRPIVIPSCRLRLRTLSPEQAIPPRKIEAEVAVGLAYGNRVMDTMRMRLAFRIFSIKSVATAAAADWTVIESIERDD